MNSITKRASAACLALLMAASVVTSAVPFSFGVNSAAVVASAEGEEENLVVIPETRPNKKRPIIANGTYTVPVYIYNIDGTGASMANQAIEHTATIVRNGSDYYATISFHPIYLGDICGHLQKLYYYNMDTDTYYSNVSSQNGYLNLEYKTEIVGDDVVYAYDDMGYDDPDVYVKYVNKATFKLPSKKTDFIIRVKVDVMGDTEQDAVLVFDYNYIASEYLPLCNEYLDECSKLNNDDGKYTEDSFNEYQEKLNNCKEAMANNAIWNNKNDLLKYSFTDMETQKKKLVETEKVLPDGVYSVPISFLETKADKINFHDIAFNTYNADENKFEFLKDMFEDTAELTAKKGVYTIALKFRNEDENYYLCDLAKTSYSYDNKLAFGGDKTIINNNDSPYIVYTGDNQPTLTIANRFSADDLIFNVVGISKTDFTINDFGMTAFDVKWDNAVKIADLELDKSELKERIDYADFWIANHPIEMYTEDSSKKYQEAYDNAVAIYTNSQIQSEVDEALANLKSAMSGLKTYKAALQEKVDEVKAVDTAEYSEVSAKALADEIAKAEELLAQDEPANDELAAEIAALDSAVAALEKKPEDLSSQDDSSSQSDDSSAPDDSSKPDDSSAPDDSSVPDDPAPAKQSIVKATVKVSNKTYTGKALKPAVTVTLGGKTLKNGTDYTVSYKNNKKVGKATVTVTGKGSYTGTKSKAFIIKPAKMKIKAAKSTAKNKIKVTWTKAKGGVTGYKVQIALNKKFTKSKKTYTVKKASAASKTITKLKSGKKYFVRVRAYKTVRKKTYYGKYSAIKTVKVK